MTQHVEVRLADGDREVFAADGWITSDGTLEVVASDDSKLGRPVATFAPGQWVFVSKVVTTAQVGEANTGATVAVIGAGCYLLGVPL